MSWSPRYQEAFESAVLDNTLAIVKRDFKSALDYFYATDNLPDFAQRTLGNFIRLDMPALAVESGPGGGDEAADGSYEGQQLKIFLYLTVDDVGPDAAARKLTKYSRALRAVLKTASTADFVANMTSSKVFGLTRELSWKPNEVAKDVNQGSWLKSITFELTLKYNEA